MRFPNDKRFSGITTALITPFSDGKIDFESLEKIIEFQLKNKVTGFVVNGTTGESPTLKWVEVKELVSFVKKVSPKTHLILGAGSNSTSKVTAMILSTADWPIDAIMSVVPYYNKPTQEGLFQHFQAAAKSTDKPFILYNVPSRTVASLSVETIQRLAEIKNIIGIKEATGDLSIAANLRKNLPNDFLLLSGDDHSCVEFIRNGGDGVISVTSHICSNEINELVGNPENQSLKNKFKVANDIAFSISSPIPIKAMLFLKGLIKSPELRLPMVQCDKSQLQEIKLKMKSAELL